VRRQGTRHRRCGLPSDDRGGDVRIDHHHGHELRGALTPIGVMLRQELLVLLVRDRRATEAVGNRHRTRAHPPAAPAPPTTAAPPSRHVARLLNPAKAHRAPPHIDQLRSRQCPTGHPAGAGTGASSAIRTSVVRVRCTGRPHSRRAGRPMRRGRARHRRRRHAGNGSCSAGSGTRPTARYRSGRRASSPRRTGPPRSPSPGRLGREA